MAVTFEREEASEWLDELQSVAPTIALPEADEDYAYAAARLLSWFPIINSRGATYEPEDFDDALLSTLVGKQVNLEHDKSRVVGSIISYSVNDEGIDIGIRIDREQAELQGLDIDEMRSGNYFSRCSVELTKDPDQSHFYAYDDGLNIRKKIPVRAGRRVGIRRTTARDPYQMQGLNVAERIKPKRFTGVGLVHNPADKTAELYRVHASEEPEELDNQRFGIGDTTSEAGSANSPMEVDPVSQEDADALNQKLADLEAQVAQLTSEKEQASADATSRIEQLTADLAAKETELATANAELVTLRSEKEVAAKEKATEELLSELHAIHPISDEEREELREKASHACGNDGVIRELKLDRREAALAAKEAALAAAPPAADPAVGETPASETPAADPAAGADAGKEGEQANDEFEPGNDPLQNIGSKVKPVIGKYRGFDEKELSILA